MLGPSVYTWNDVEGSEVCKEQYLDAFICPKFGCFHMSKMKAILLYSSFWRY